MHRRELVEMMEKDERCAESRGGGRRMKVDEIVYGATTRKRLRWRAQLSMATVDQRQWIEQQKATGPWESNRSSREEKKRRRVEGEQKCSIRE